MHITLITTSNRYETTSYFVQGLAKALEKKGVTISQIKVQDGGIANLLDQLDTQMPDMTLSFSDIQCGGKGLQAFTKIPHFSYFLDPAIYFLHQTIGLVSCCDAKDVTMLKGFGYQDVFFLPNAVTGEQASYQPLDQRRFDMVYFGTCFDPNEQKARWQKLYSKAICEQLHLCADQILTTPNSTFEVMCAQQIEEKYFLTLFHELDHYIRAKDRIDLLQALPQKRLTVWGDGQWSNFLPNANCFPAVSFDETLRLMNESKFVLNSSPRFKEGIHERIFYAFMQGAIPLTNTSIQLAIDYSDDFSYRIGHHTDVLEKLLYLEANYEEIVEKGRATTIAKHTWDQRASCLLKQRHCGQRISS